MTKGDLRKKMTLEQAIQINPFNVEQGNLAAYCRYLRYNVDGLYEKSNKYVQRLFIKYIFDEIAKKARNNMADDVELIIKIDKNTYDRIASGFADEDDAVLFENLLKNGIPLPKGHGSLMERLINIVLDKNYCHSCKHHNNDNNEVCLECEFDGITRGMTRYEPILQEPKTEWIPVSERLPEKSTWVLVTCKNPDGYIYLDIKLINQYTGLWDGDEDFIGTVLAWMPLPEPCKAESEE